MGNWSIFKEYRPEWELAKVKNCWRCKEIRPWSDFHKLRLGLFGLNTICKLCRKPDAKRIWANKTELRKLYDSVVSRANRQKLECSIAIDDIVIPEKCPVFGVKFDPVASHLPYPPSVDRIDSSRGYTKDNIQIISARANILKNNMTPEEVTLLARFMNGDKCLWEPKQN